MSNVKGYFEVGIYQTKTEKNVGTLWRSAYQLGAMGVFTISKRYCQQASDTPKVQGQIPLRHYETFDNFKNHIPENSTLIGIEIGGISLSSFTHPRMAVYLLGAEDNGLPDEIREQCKHIVSIESLRMESYNVAIAGSIVMWHRMFGHVH